MTLEQYLHSHPKEFNGLEQHTKAEAQERSKAGLVPTLAMWGLSSLAAAYVSLFGIPTGNDAKYLNVPVAAAEASSAMRLPDLSGAKYLGEKHKDRFKEIPGNDTTLRGYKLGNKTITTYEFPNGNIYAFLIKENGINTWFTDNDADGTYEQVGKDARVDLKSYGY